MIEMIKGDFKATRCSCGRLFKFQDEDVKHLIKKRLFGKNTYTLIDFVVCPSCSNRIFEHKGGWL